MGNSTNFEVDDYNENKLETLNSKVWKLNAKIDGPRGYTPSITLHGTIA